ncbi:MAG: exodeoxyribonuclease VII small subunit [Gemmatimonadetes bacterium]|nr:exodeoxyribonuclease VII small subunit [Gemmatimonadota bacterium]
MTRLGDQQLEFETAIAELEEIVERLDREGVGLDEAVSLFEQGVARLKRANEWLDRASGRIEELIATAEGFETRPLSEPDDRTPAADDPEREEEADE